MSAVVTVESESQSLQVAEPKEVTPTSDFLPLTADRKAFFLDTVIKTGGNISKAATLLGTTRQNVYRWTQSDPAFAQALENALEYGTENLEEAYYGRAMEMSDRAAEFLLKARRPDKYRDDPTPRVNVNINLNSDDVLSFLDTTLVDSVDSRE